MGPTASVNRFGKILPLWQNFKSVWLLFEGLFVLGKILNLIGQIFMLLDKLPLLLFAQHENIIKQSGHTTYCTETKMLKFSLSYLPFFDDRNALAHYDISH